MASRCIKLAHALVLRILAEERALHPRYASMDEWDTEYSLCEQ